MCLEAARVAAPTHCGPPRAQVRVHTVYEERPSEWTEWTAFGNVTVGIRGSIVVRRQDGNYSQIYEDAQVGVVYTLNVTLVAQSAGRVQVGGTTVRLQFASTHGNCVPIIVHLALNMASRGVQRPSGLAAVGGAAVGTCAAVSAAGGIKHDSPVQMSKAQAMPDSVTESTKLAYRSGGLGVYVRVPET